MPAPLRRAIAFMLLTLAFGASACGDPTGPAEARLLIDATEEELAAAMLMVDDVTERLFPSIAQLSGVAELDAAVAALSDAVRRAHAEDLESNALRAANALAAVRAQSGEAETPDLDAITLAIEESKRLLKYPTGSGRSLPSQRTP
jgi:hypothetical protein